MDDGMGLAERMLGLPSPGYSWCQPVESDAGEQN